jgi:hypothetical protein
MAAGVHNIKHTTGDSFRKTWYYKTYPSLTAINLSGYSASMVIEREGSTVMTLTSGTEITLGSDGSIAIVLTGEQETSLETALAISPCRYSLTLTSGSGIVTKTLVGSISRSNT